ncbi:Gfo/Idh/MocA family oxidoreductase [Candidatus Poribacteria bacterium]|nr:Gfo/Idh/MocA family oxidoreductase [Candidatus Poribacteria bacterium]MYH80670.1 Gfo/Idh/MocA family oxidoreductase [Candidatus Poribacteria bacterium]MYK94341.1 Gfo/Idh/MocA family oxidoreductase [Candidatus Poribacteria bacterium]
MSKLRVAVIGCGGRGRGHMKILSQFDDTDLVAVCDPVEAARNNAADALNVPNRYESIDELLDSESLDAIFVATPAHLNGEAALPCFERGVHTLLEKPPGMSVAETVALRTAAERTGAKGMVGWNRRFHPIIVEAKRQVTARGPVTQIVGEFHKSITRLTGRFPEHLMDNMFLETPIHALDTIRAVAETDVQEVHSVVQRAISDYKDVHAALILFDNGCVAQHIANYTTDARLERYEIHGRDISAYLEGVSHGTVFCDGTQHQLTEAGTGGTVEQNRYFLDCVKSDTPVSLPAANLDEAVKTMQLAEDILDGLR